MEREEQFSPDPENIRAARSMVRDSLAAVDDAELAELLTTELSANAVHHAGTPFTVAVSHDDEGMLTVEVHDHDSRLPVIPTLDPAAVRGRGLLLVDTLAREWGVTVIHDDGKTVWFRLSPTAD
jgi:anti-sigma regulatory factor (Ser/Thr protein kinase)